MLRGVRENWDPSYLYFLAERYFLFHFQRIFTLWVDPIFQMFYFVWVDTRGIIIRTVTARRSRTNEFSGHGDSYERDRVTYAMSILMLMWTLQLKLGAAIAPERVIWLDLLKGSPDGRQYVCLSFVFLEKCIGSKSRFLVLFELWRTCRLDRGSLHSHLLIIFSVLGVLGKISSYCRVRWRLKSRLCTI